MVAAMQLFLLLVVAVLEISSIPLLRIQQGFLRGQYLTSRKGRTFSSFTAIPYAKPPVGDLRFQAPQPAGPWNGVLNATNPHPICPQSGIFFGNPAVSGVEDCLYLNVYTPQLSFPGIGILPVMIWFHGGAFVFGNANRDLYDPAKFMDYNVILITTNYRIGPLGFLSTGDAVVPGNNGLKDQNLAIKWAKKNIYRFGGDPKSITVFGQSAGAVSAHYHMLSPLSRDLINGVISESGTAFAPWGLAPDGEGPRNARRLAEYFNCTTDSSYEMVECLKSVDASAITSAQNTFIVWYQDPIVFCKPVIEPNIPGAFLTKHPRDIIKDGEAAQVPFLTGINTQEGAVRAAGIFGNPILLTELNDEFDTLAPITLLYEETAPDVDLVSTSIREFYFDDSPIDNSSHAEVTNMYTDSYFLEPVNEALRLHFKYTNKPVYNYAFGYRGTISLSVLSGDPFYNYGVSHNDELIYLYSIKLFFPDYVPSEADEKITDVLTTLWTNFATTGNPTPTISPVIPTKWRPVRSKNLEYFFIKNYTDLHMEQNLYYNRSQFWKYLPTK